MTSAFAVYSADENRIFSAIYARTEAEALDEYAGWRSGYETFSEMARSRVFQDIGACDVTARAVTA